MITSNSHMNPVYGQEEINNVNNYMNSGSWIMEHTQTRTMEQMLSDYTGAKYTHMVPSATMGLLLASMVAEIQHGEHFAVSAYTQAATANGAILMGGVPVIVDVDPVHHTIDFDKIPDNCRVIFVSAINGRYPDDIAQRIANLRSQGKIVIEDSAQALGSFARTGEHCGTMGDMGIFSFGAPKIITTGQGGAVFTNDETISNRINAIKNFGRTVSVGEIYNTMGMNFKFTDIQASFGIEQVKRLPEVVSHRRWMFDEYKSHLQDVCDFVHTDTSITTPTYPEILVDNRDELVLYLRENKIGCRAVYDSLCNQPYHSQWKTPTPVTELLSSRGVHLPAQADLNADDIKYISDIIKDYVA